MIVCPTSLKEKGNASEKYRKPSYASMLQVAKDEDNSTNLAKKPVFVAPKEYEYFPTTNKDSAQMNQVKVNPLKRSLQSSSDHKRVDVDQRESRYDSEGWQTAKKVKSNTSEHKSVRTITNSRLYKDVRSNAMDIHGCSSTAAEGNVGNKSYDENRKYSKSVAEKSRNNENLYSDDGLRKFSKSGSQVSKNNDEYSDIRRKYSKAMVQKSRNIENQYSDDRSKSYSKPTGQESTNVDNENCLESLKRSKKLLGESYIHENRYPDDGNRKYSKAVGEERNKCMIADGTNESINVKNTEIVKSRCSDLLSKKPSKSLPPSGMISYRDILLNAAREKMSIGKGGSSFQLKSNKSDLSTSSVDSYEGKCMSNWKYKEILSIESAPIDNKLVL